MGPPLFFALRLSPDCHRKAADPSSHRHEPVIVAELHEEDEMVRKLSFVALLCATALTAVPAWAQPSVTEEIAALRAQMEAMSERLEAVEQRAIRAETALAQSQATPTTAPPAAPAV